MAQSETRIAGKYRQEQIIKIPSLLGYLQGWVTKNKWFATTTTTKRQNKTITTRKWRIYAGKWLLLQKRLELMARSKFREEKNNNNKTWQTISSFKGCILTSDGNNKMAREKRTILALVHFQELQFRLFTSSAGPVNPGY